MKNIKNIFVLILLSVSAIPTLNYKFVNAAPKPKFLYQPKSTEYLNPYELMIKTYDEMKTIKNRKWMVYANRADTPILNDQQNKIDTARFLEPFYVKSKKGIYLKVRSKGSTETGRTKRGWIDMRHLMLHSKAIKEPAKRVRLKVLQNIKIQNITIQNFTNNDIGIDRLRFRPGPGNLTQYPTETSDAPKTGGLFFYVYGVHFNDDNNLNSYQDVEKSFQKADYFLVGDLSSFYDADDLKKKVIRGWIPGNGAVLWTTRKASEVLPDRERMEAHKFKNRKLLNQYFSLDNENQRAGFINENRENIIRDTGYAPPSRGQKMRDIVFSREQKIENVISEHIGHTGAFSGHQTFLANLQEGARNIEIFFLIDATLSMEPCRLAAAKIADEIIKEISGDDINIVTHGAVFRDITEGFKRFQEWNPELKSLSSWLKKDVKIISGNPKTGTKDPDYEESLFYGIRRAINSWTFKHPFSVRVMIIMGDTGDNGRVASQKEEKLTPTIIADRLMKKGILPVVIHLDHGWTEPNKPTHVKMERNAMKLFFTHFEKINNKVYKDTLGYKRIIRFETKSNKGETANTIAERLKEKIRKEAGAIASLIKSMPDIRLGIKTIKDQICDMGYKNKENLKQGCKNTLTVEEFKKFIRENEPSGGVNLFISYLNQLKNNDPNAWQYVMNAPEAGFQEAFVAVKEGTTKFTKPVLLLGTEELGKIKNAINTIRSNHRDCSEEVNSIFLKQAMATVLGELLQINPETVTKEDAGRWFQFIKFELSGTFINAGDIVYNMCSDANRGTIWADFLNRFKKVEEYIDDMRAKGKERKRRLFRDLNGYPYYWVYPEKLFPKVVQRVYK